MDIPKVIAGLNVSVEVRCPFCQNLNKYQALTAVHGNVKNYYRKAEKDRGDLSVEAKCDSCNKYYKIVKTAWM